MKKKLTYLLIIIIVLTIIGITKIFVIDKTGSQGKVKVVSSPIASVLLNGKPVGRTPYESVLNSGEYQITLIPDERTSTNSAQWDGKINIYAHTLTFVSRELGESDIDSSGVILSVIKMDSKPEIKNTGEIQISTEPDGSIVYLDNEEQGISPFLMSNVAPGNHELSVYSSGFSRRTEKIKVIENQRLIAHFKLAFDPTYKKIDVNKIKEASESAKINSNKFVVITDTETGFLRVRSAPNRESSESAQVNPGDKFKVLDTTDDWYKIEYEVGKFGWILSTYAKNADSTGDSLTPTLKPEPTSDL